jgi:hypothetical protein
VSVLNESRRQKNRRASETEIARHQHIHEANPLTSRFLKVDVGNLRRLRERGRSMPMHSPTGENWPDAMQPLEMRRRARDIANLAEYLAEEVRGHPNRALDAMGALAEWCEDDPELVAHARTEVLRHRRREAVTTTVENNRQALELLALVDSAS